MRLKSINQSYFICQHEELHTINYNFVNISTYVAAWQATTKAAELIKLVTYYNNANEYCAN